MKVRVNSQDIEFISHAYLGHVPGGRADVRLVSPLAGSFPDTSRYSVEFYVGDQLVGQLVDAPGEKEILFINDPNQRTIWERLRITGAPTWYYGGVFT